MIYNINLLDSTIDVEVSFKNIKTVRLKVFQNRDVKLSVPLNTPKEWVVKFLESKRGWIEEKLSLLPKAEAIKKETHIKSGAFTRIMGTKLQINIVSAASKRIEKTDDTLYIYTNCPENQNAVDKQLNNWLQKSAKQYFILQMENLYPIIEKYGIKKPKIAVKKMRTLWGSCSRSYGNVNLNFYLYKAPVSCIEYVILHELTHFLYHYHDKNFYDFIAVYMPDWKERKKLLDREVDFSV